MRKFIAALAAVAALFAAVAFATPAQAAVPTYNTVERQFIAAIHKYDPSTRNAYSSTLLKIGYANCAALSKGASPARLMRAGTDQGVREFTVFTVLAASASYLCPTHYPAVATYAKYGA